MQLAFQVGLHRRAGITRCSDSHFYASLIQNFDGADAHPSRNDGIHAHVAKEVR